MTGAAWQDELEEMESQLTGKQRRIRLPFTGRLRDLRSGVEKLRTPAE